MPWSNPDYQDDNVYDPANPLQPEEPTVQTEEPTVQSRLIGDDDIEVLNEARTVLKKIADRSRNLAMEPHVRNQPVTQILLGPDAFDMGLVFAHATDTEHAIFETLNVIHSYARAEMTDDQLHNRR